MREEATMMIRDLATGASLGMGRWHPVLCKRS